jgi:outer membrane protein TolC
MTCPSLRMLAFGFVAAVISVVVVGCGDKDPDIVAIQRPNVAPDLQRVDRGGLQLEQEHVKPMFTETLAIDLATVVAVACADNIAIRQARLSVDAHEGQYESAVGGVLPAIAAGFSFNRVDGHNQNTDGRIFHVGLYSISPNVAVEWVVNPGRVYYDVIAARKRLSAAEHNSQAVVMDVLRRATVQFYDLVLAQARVSTAVQSVTESEELLRINRLQIETGVGVVADELRAIARLAAREQDLIQSLLEVYDASVGLAVTLRLDATVTLVPKMEQLPPIQLVRDDIAIDELLALAVEHRPDLERLRSLIEAAVASRGSTWWGAFGPQFYLGYDYSLLGGHANSVIPNDDGSLSDQTYKLTGRNEVLTNVGWRLSLSAAGDLKSASAVEHQTNMELVARLDSVQGEVVRAVQAATANRELIGLAQRQVEAAAEALRLSEANLEAGAATTLDVLQTQDAVMHARLRQAESIVRYNQSQVILLSALGLIDEVALAGSGPESDPKTDPDFDTSFGLNVGSDIGSEDDFGAG